MTKNLLKEYKKILSIADAGLYFGNDEYDKERYQELRDIALELIEMHSDTKLEVLKDIVSYEEGYPTPKIDVRAFIVEDGKVLLVKDSKTKEWSLPGGFAEIGLSPKENILKEVEEETGLKVKVDKLVAVFDSELQKERTQLFQYYKLVFKCTKLSGEFKKNIEISDLDYFSIDKLPKLSINRNTPEQIQRLFEIETIDFD